ncbi:MAG: DUF58 domain-containing protein [Holophagaceae bacterium]|nr:DUF58 domain-containing protein [Holophagaceae bacterium]
MAVLLATALPAVWRPALLSIWIIAGTMLIVVLSLDALRAFLLEPPAAARRVAGSLPLGAWSDVGIRLRNASGAALRLNIYDHHPERCETRGLPQEVDLGPGAWAEVHYRVRPMGRGLHAFGPVQVLLDSPWGFWRRNGKAGQGETVKVYPNFAMVAGSALRATDRRLPSLGILRKRRRGEGMEFNQLREYRRGDALRQIDWKATSRMRKLISKEYQEERDQQVVILLDCGRRMRSKESEIESSSGQLSHFDHALNALLLLGYVALRQGDAVGLQTFGGPARVLNPRKAMPTLNAFLNALYDLEPTTHASDFLAAAKDCATRLTKRSLVVVVSNLRDEDSEDLQPALALLRKRHLVLFVSLREAALDAALQDRIHDFRDALRAGALHDYLGARREAFDRLRAHGALCMDVLPQNLAAGLVNRYLEIKRSGRL